MSPKNRRDFLKASGASLAAGGLWWYQENLPEPGDQAVVAGTAEVLTPAGATAFTEPVFTWTTDNGGVVRIEVIDPVTGETLATLDRAYSPVRFSSMERFSTLAEGRAYRVAVRDAKKGRLLADGGFATIAGGEGAPQRAGALDDVLRQCESYVGAGRPADAWMIWAELSGDEKADPRMQALRERILAKLAD